jgi:hypothetical protein
MTFSEAQHMNGMAEQMRADPAFSPAFDLLSTCFSRAFRLLSPADFGLPCSFGPPFGREKKYENRSNRLLKA